MVRTFILFVVCWLSLSAEAVQVCDLPPQWREQNYAGGSCGHASTVSALRWVQMYTAATQWRAKYAYGERESRHLQKVINEGLLYAATSDGDESLLTFALANRRMAIVYWPDGHIVNLVGKVTGNDNQTYAVILDNNSTKKYKYREWNSWVRSWRQTSGFAIVIMSGEVPPPVPQPHS